MEKSEKYEYRGDGECIEIEIMITSKWDWDLFRKSVNKKWIIQE